MQRALTSSEIEELNTLYARPLALPTADSRFATDQSRLLFKEVHGDDEYRRNLRAFARELLDELIASNPSLAGRVRKWRHEHIASLSLLLHSLAHVASFPVRYKVIAVSLNSTDYRPGKSFDGLSYTIVSRVVGMLTNPEIGEPLCWQRKGTFDRSFGSGVRTRLAPGENLKDRLAQAGLIWPTHPHSRLKAAGHVVVIKDRNTNEKTPVSRELLPNESVLQSVNARLRKTEFKIHFPNYKSYESSWDYSNNYFEFTTEGQLRRQFVDDDSSGGRLTGLGLQNLPKRLRQFLTINGEPVYEYDYQGCQVYLAYAELSVEPPPGNPYDIPSYGPEYRDVFKALFTVLIGSDKDQSLMSAFSLAVQKRTGAFLESGQAEAMADAFWSHHPALKKLSNTEAWKRLQYRESEIMLDVLNRLEAQGIPCIPIHDAVIGPLSRAYEIRRAMNSAARDIEMLTAVPASWTAEAYPQFSQ